MDITDQSISTATQSVMLRPRPRRGWCMQRVCDGRKYNVIVVSYMFSIRGEKHACMMQMSKGINMPATGRPIRCNWCGAIKPLIDGKRFCSDCARDGRECAHCHRPMPKKYYSLDESRCNACFRRHQRQLAISRNRE